MKKTLFCFCLFVTATLNLNACREDVREVKDVQVLPECYIHDDCHGGLICVEQHCVPEPVDNECETDADCLDNEICVANTCAPKFDGPDCETDADCLDNRICKENVCVPKTSDPECRSDADCSANQICKENACVPKTADPECESDADCPSNQICKSNACVPKTADPECESDADCPENQICKENACVPKTDDPECKTDADCPEGLSCDADGNCILQCDSDRLCFNSEIMDGGFECCKNDEICLTRGCYLPDTSCNDNYACKQSEYCELESHTCLPSPLFDTECKTKDLMSGGQIKPQLLYHWGEGELAPGGDFPDHTNVMMTPVVADIDGDTMPEIVFSSWLKNSMTYGENGILRIISGKDGKLLASGKGKTDEVNALLDPSSHMAVGRLYPKETTTYNGVDVTGLQIVACTEDHKLAIFNHKAELIWRNPKGGPNECSTTAMGLADFNGDGLPEIYSHYAIYDARSGKQLIKAEEKENAKPNYSITADLDDDGLPEIIGGNVAYKVDWKNGKLIELYHRADQPDGFPSIADLDLDGKPEIVTVRTNQYSGTSFDHLSHTVMAFRSDGTDFWTSPVDTHLGTLDAWGGGPAAIARIDDDPHPSILISSGTHFIAIDYKGGIKWSHEVQDLSSRTTGSTVFDFNGDGKAEILYADEEFFRVYDGTSGDTVYCLCNTSTTLYEYPVVADVNRDGHAEIVLTSNRLRANKNCPGSAQYYKGDVDSCIQSLMSGPYTGLRGTSGLRVFGGKADDGGEISTPSEWMPTRSIYNQHAYSVTNILDDGTVPSNVRANWKIDGLNNFRLNVLPKAKDYLVYFDIYRAMISTEQPCREKQPVHFSIFNSGQTTIPAGMVIQVDVRMKKSDTEPLQTYYVETKEAVPVGKTASLTVDILMPSNVDSLYLSFLATQSDRCRWEDESKRQYTDYELKCE